MTNVQISEVQVVGPFRERKDVIEKRRNNVDEVGGAGELHNSQCYNVDAEESQR